MVNFPESYKSLGWVGGVPCFGQSPKKTFLFGTPSLIVKVFWEPSFIVNVFLEASLIVKVRPRGAAAPHLRC